MNYSIYNAKSNHFKFLRWNISVRSVVKTVKEMRLDESLRLYILHPVLKKVILQIMID